MDKKKSLLNVSFSVAFRIAILIVNILVRRYLINYIGNAVNGLNSLYASILDFLAVAELGVGTAITFCMYKPIVDGDNDKVSAFYHLFTKLYLIIGGIILVAGCAVMPFLPLLAKGYADVEVNLYLTFGFVLVAVVTTYIFSSKTSLINAYKNNYVTTTVYSVSILLQCIVQIVVVIFTHSFVWFLVCRIFASIAQWLATEFIARAKYGYIIKNKQKADAETKKEVVKNVKAMFMHKIGNVLVNGADSLIISAFIGIVILGKYSNYYIVMAALTSVLSLVFTSLTSIVGHMSVDEDKEEVKRYHNFFHTLNFILGLVFFLGYFAVIDNLVIIFFKGEDLILSKSVSFIITLNGFIQYMRQATLLFRDATGTFYNDRWKALFEGLLNIVLSILFVIVFPEEYKIVGVIVATILTNIFICHIVEPYVLFKYAFDSKTKRYYLKNYVYIAIFTVSLVGLNFAMVQYTGSHLVTLLLNGLISVGISLIVGLLAILTDRNFKNYFKKMFTRIKQKASKK